MIRIIKDDAPAFWTDFLKHNKNVRIYDDLEKSDDGKEVRQKIRIHMISQQKFICCYCCGEINEDDSHNEHIRPRDKKQDLSLDYNNMLVSCNTSNQCGKLKGGYYSENDFVSPLDEDVEEQFKYSTDGEIIGLKKGVEEKIINETSKYYVSNTEIETDKSKYYDVKQTNIVAADSVTVGLIIENVPVDNVLSAVAKLVF